MGIIRTLVCKRRSNARDVMSCFLIDGRSFFTALLLFERLVIALLALKPSASRGHQGSVAMIFLLCTPDHQSPSGVYDAQPARLSSYCDLS